MGGLVLTSFPELEKQGANLTVESFLRSIQFAAERMKVTSFRNIYLQLDNCPSNKCETLLVACGTLVGLGICKKIKINFLEVGHTHEDIDALIGTVVVKLRAMDLPTFDSRIEVIMSALKHEGSKIRVVDEVIGMTDYNMALKPYFAFAKGISNIKEFRIFANEEGNPVFLYKTNSTVDGWYPRPFERE